MVVGIDGITQVYRVAPRTIVDPARQVQVKPTHASPACGTEIQGFVIRVDERGLVKFPGIDAVPKVHRCGPVSIWHS